MQPLNYANLTIEQRESLLSASYMFVSALNDVLGAEKAHELWSELASIDADLKLELFQTMLEGGGGLRVTITKIDPHVRVPVIKAVRLATGLGLKEAKDLTDEAFMHGRPAVVVSNNMTAGKNLRAELRQLGVAFI